MNKQPYKLATATSGQLRHAWKKGIRGVLRLHETNCWSMSPRRSYELALCDCDVRFVYMPHRKTTDHMRNLRKWEA